MRCLLFLSLFLTITFVSAQSTIRPEWEKHFGGNYEDQAKAILPSGDGGYILIGSTTSSGNGGKDAMLVKISASGDVVWEKTFGKEMDDQANAGVVSADGNYIITGSIYNKQISNNSWWVFAVDKNGNKLWENSYGASEWDEAKAIVATSDGYVITGVRKNTGDHNKEMNVMKINKKGAKIWEISFGVRYYDNEATAIAATADEGFIVTGWSKKDAGPTKQIYLVKIDKRGAIEWQKGLGGEELDCATSIAVTSDGRFIIAAYSRSKSNGEEDIRIIKTDNKGVPEWDSNFGGLQSDQPFSLITTSDNGCVVGGFTKSIDGDKEKSFLLKIDRKGKLVWERYFGNYEASNVSALISIPGGLGYVAAGKVILKKDEEADMFCMKLTDNYDKELESYIAEKIKGGDKRTKDEISAEAFEKLKSDKSSFAQNNEVFIKEEVAYRGSSDPFKGTNVKNASKDMKVGKYYALFIGVDAYSGAWTPLKNAVNDAKALEILLKQKYQLDVSRSLYNTQASRTAIISEFEWLVANVKENDNVLIYYSGHGEFKKELNKGFWVPVDAKTTSTSQFISNADIQTFLASIPSKHTLLISDACFSGDIFRGTTATIPFENTEKYYANTYNAKSRQAISSGGIEPVMDGGKEGHSVFSYYLLQALKTNDTKYFDSSQLYNKIKVPVVNNSDQSPNFNPIKNTGDEGGHFLFIKK